MALLKVLALCTVEGGKDAIDKVARNCDVEMRVVGLNPRSPSVGSASGFIDVAELAAALNIPYSYVTRYDLNCSADVELLTHLSYDVIWVAGWQRLIPEWLIRSARLGAIGAHGGPDGIEKSRGRSPQNWALMLGCPSFEVSLFRITPNVDDGPVIATREFSYDAGDDITDSYRKCSAEIALMMMDVCDGRIDLRDARSQSGEPAYFPRRKPEDGLVDWTLSSKEIWAHCRALTRPYPGLRTFYDEEEIVIWRSRPVIAAGSSQPGTIIDLRSNGALVVQCGDGQLMIEEWLADKWAPSLGQKLTSHNYVETLENICDRHRRQYPKQAINRRVLDRISNSSYRFLGA